MVPHLVRWDQQYRSRGLVVVDVDDGRIDTKDAVAKHVASKKLGFPVLWDRGGKVVAKYGVRMYPTAALIGADGKVLWKGIPQANRAGEYAAMIEKALAHVDLEALKKNSDPFVTSSAKSVNQATQKSESH